MITVTHTYAGNFIIPPAITNRRCQGIPPGGPADPFLSTLALHLANSDTCLEITSLLTLTTTKPTQIALAAPPNSQPLANQPTTSLALIPLVPGEPLTIHSPKTGYRLYLAWPGLISSSRFPAPITTTTQLPSIPTPSPKSLTFDPSLVMRSSNLLFYVSITEVNISQTTSPLTRLEVKSMSNEFSCQVTPHMSRIGARLSYLLPFPFNGKREGSGWGDISRSNSHDLLTQLANQTLPKSEPSIQGAIQVTPDKQLLIHGPDGPTLGGYPKLGVIANFCLPQLAQLRPGEQVQLQEITIEEALLKRQQYQKFLAKTLAKIDQALRIARS